MIRERRTRLVPKGARLNIATIVAIVRLRSVNAYTRNAEKATSDFSPALLLASWKNQD